MCLHETIQLSQDGERIIVCGDCGREFAKIAEDDNETLVVPLARSEASPRNSYVVILDGDLTAERGVAINNHDGELQAVPTYPCARCGFSMSCPKVEGEPCHT
jgi:hypothetical protein